MTRPADHKVWPRRRGWVAAQDLTRADEVKLPSRAAIAHEVGEPQEPPFFHLLGLFLSAANDDPHALHLDRCARGAFDAEQVDGLAHYAAENWSSTASANQHRYDD